MLSESKILDGKKLADKLNFELKKEIEFLVKKTNVIPTLATVLVGVNPASKIYVKIKHRTSDEVGINSVQVTLPEDCSKETLNEELDKLNKNNSIHGILLQLPLPGNLREYTSEFLTQISPQKDVDGFHPINRGKLFDYDEELAPCTPKGIIALLKYNDVALKGKDIVIVNRSNLVGKPLLFMFLKRNATVSICHTSTKDINSYLKKADIIVVAVGQAKFLTPDKIKQGAIIIDAGINRVENKIIGDVDFENIIDKAGKITPVPGGVGPMTVSFLLQNTIIAYKKQLKLD
ncbi:MAG: bifunctional 5,10-methylenetetrahydrofolate dehydrogenase/5,10-methenyltetrahydrofolate cyclohydrolase [Promethearchaeota archaeon]|nr:MAG: bifunctional 5,10-methylenetetrahydrofolate dehydrogenase/5,10-methenyltetrahydrofolate cyclohydrolase [Candidatus Lokiarchaeota archaeon]